MKAAILLVSSHSTLVLLGADRLYLEENGYTTYKVFLSLSFFECTFSYNHHRNVFSSTTNLDLSIEGDISPSLADPALLSVVGDVDGQCTGFITKESRNFIYRAHWSRLLSRPASSKERDL